MAWQAGQEPHRSGSQATPGAGAPRPCGTPLLHWRFFERFANQRSGWLAPDNFPGEPAACGGDADLPTNIGLQFLATMSAWDLGIISLPEMVDRLEKAFDSLDSLPRHRGHFYNWYGLDPLRRLDPAYVSTVDSGNLVGHLVALRQGLLRAAASPP